LASTISCIGHQELTKLPERKTTMLHLAQRTCGEFERHCDASAALAVLPTSSASPEEVDSRLVRHARSLQGAQFCYCHFAELAPEIADELRAAWGDVKLLACVIEQLLGGERSVHLDIEPALEFARLYLHLEGIRTLPEISLTTGSPEGAASACRSMSDSSAVAVRRVASRNSAS
jgi:hypothetical protein